MKKSIIFIILIGTVLMLSGCVDQTNDVTTVDGPVIHVTDISQINEALVNGPVLLKMGAERCPACRDQDPIIDDLAELYEGTAAVMYIDTDESPDLVNFFNVNYIPDSCVIVGVENGKYIYMIRDGTTSAKRESARFIGLTDKQTLAKTLDYSIEKYNER